MQNLLCSRKKVANTKSINYISRESITMLRNKYLNPSNQESKKLSSSSWCSLSHPPDIWLIQICSIYSSKSPTEWGAIRWFEHRWLDLFYVWKLPVTLFRNSIVYFFKNTCSWSVGIAHLSFWLRESDKPIRGSEINFCRFFACA